MKIKNEPWAYAFLITLVYVFFIVAMFFLAPGCRRDYRTMSPDLRLDEHTLEVFVQCPDKGKGGSGVLIGNNLALTANHVTTCTTSPIVVVRTLSGTTYAARVVRAWATRDVAVLEVPGIGRAPRLPFAEAKTRTLACSSSRYPAPRHACGEVVDVHAMRCPKGEWCYDGDYTGNTVPGNSGSPLYNARGELIGLTTGYDDDGGSFFTQLYDLRYEVYE